LHLNAYLKKQRTVIDDELEKYLDLRSDLFGTLIDSMRYSLFAGGKRIRPILALAACEAVGGEIKKVLPAACALEIIHTFTLIHDDLPCMDNDDMRRGRPANHKVFGEAQALLAGCSLLTITFEIISGQCISGDIDAERAISLTHILSRAAGWEGVMGGQSLDMIYEGEPSDIERVKAVCHHKTATLITASLACGAVAGGASETQVDALTHFGHSIGLAFQVADDILDVEGEAQKLGKSTGTDARAGKVTFPALMGLVKAKSLAQKLLDESLSALDEFDSRADPLRKIARYIVTRDR
jgi:geranylgeranyl diphosphate synthase, type II